MENFLITGATGFIGAVLLRKLVDLGENVFIIIKKNSNTWRIKDLLELERVKVYFSDLMELDQLSLIIKDIKPTVIYHLATHGAYSYQNDANNIINTNILGTWNLIQACNNIEYKLFVNTGSSSEYGRKNYAMRETDILEPESYYAVSKCAQTLLCINVAKQESKPIVIFRPFSVYGPFEEPKRFIPTLMKSLFLKKEMDLVSPEISRDQIFIDDIIDSYLKIEELKKNAGECFNIGAGAQSSIKDVVETAMKITKINIRLNWQAMEPRGWDTSNWVADISKARQLLKWSPKIDLEEGLSLTWEWFLKNNSYYL
jgi:nucleoside-diphosphate-sugar epimerase